MLRSVDWKLVTDILGQPVGPVFKRKAMQDNEVACDILQLFS
jgi:hypothetical protein